jgi:hypothetical protein
MASPSIPYPVDAKQQEAIIRYVVNCVESLANVWNLRQQFYNRDLIYYREVDRSKEQSLALQANLAGDPTKFQNVVVPVVMPQVESALAYNAGVFLTGYPIFGVTSGPKETDAAMQMESIIADNSIHWAWIRQMVMFMRDCLKYNFGALEVEWAKEKVYSVVNDPAQAIRTGQGSQQEIYYEGNKLTRRDPYNLIFDRRVLNPIEIPQKGEFIGYTELMSRVALKQYLLNLPAEATMNGRQAFESGTPSITLSGSDSWFYIPQINPYSFIGTQTMPTTNWMVWAMMSDEAKKNAIQYNNMYEVTTMYGRIIPSDFTLKVPQRNQPQIWKFVVVNRRVVVYVERQTNAHNLLPILIGQMNEDGLGYQTKSFLDNAAPFQAMSTATWNAMMESKRRLVFDRLFYDPSRIRKEDIDKVGTVGRVPVKQSAYGKPVGDAVYAFPYRDDNSSDMLSTSEKLNDMADLANGQNRVDRGQFQKGNKTKTEFQTVMGNSNSRQQLQALGIEYQVMVPLKEILKLNMIQYQSEATYFNRTKGEAVTVKPEDIRKASLAFKLSDGLLPTDKMLSMDLLQVFMQTIQTSPMMQAEFDMVGAFIYWCKEQGATWLNDFRRPEDQKQLVLNQLKAMETPPNPNSRPQNQQGPGGGQ